MTMMMETHQLQSPKVVMRESRKRNNATRTPPTIRMLKMFKFCKMLAKIWTKTIKAWLMEAKIFRAASLEFQTRRRR